MSATDLITALAEILLAGIFLFLAWRAVQDRARSTVEMALFFGLLDALLLRATLGLADSQAIGVASAALAFVLPYLMLRLLAGFTRVPALLLRSTEIAFVALVLSAVVYPGGLPPPPVVIVRTLYFIVVFGYSALGFSRLARGASGVTRRRMGAIVVGSVLFAVTLIAAATAALFPTTAVPASSFLATGLLGASVAWLAGFAPPTPLRRFWQEAELRGFVTRTAGAMAVGDESATAREIVEAAEEATGAHAALGLWDERAQLMRFQDASGREYAFPPGSFLAWRAFAERRPTYGNAPARDDPGNADMYRARGIGAVLSAPVIGRRPVGVLVVHASSALIFPRSDLELVRLMASQAAILLEARALMLEASHTQAREEAARLREEFVAGVAHDLKQPLTAFYGRAQLLQRRIAQRTLPDVADADRMVADARRLISLIDRLLDSSQIEQGRLEIHPRAESIGILLRGLHADRMDGASVHLGEIDDALTVAIDRLLIDQVVQNLVENGVKYGGGTTPVIVSVRRDGALAHLTVRDEGIGIPAEELERVFERFRRGSNVDEKRTGFGLGLFISRGIVEAHGGKIWAESELGRGTTLHVTLPLASQAGPWEVTGDQSMSSAP